MFLVLSNIKDHLFLFYVGLLRQPKWGHLKDLHRAIKLCEPALVSAEPTVTPLGNYQEVRFTLVFFKNVSHFKINLN